MKWMELLQNSIFFSVSIAGASFVMKEYVGKLFNKDLERFKANLEKEAIEFRVRYEKIHGDRVDVLKEVYKKIVSTYISFSSLLQPMQMTADLTEAEKAKVAVKNADDLVKYYEENRIFFEEKLAIDVDRLILEFKIIWSFFLTSRLSGQLNDNQSKYEQRNNAWNKIQEEVPTIKTKLENKFRGILGIE